MRRFNSWRRSGVRWALVCALATAVIAEDEAGKADEPADGGPAWEEANPLPRRFPRHTDANGCRWGLESDGAVALSGSAAHPTLSLFRHAGRLRVEDNPFVARTAVTTPDGSRVRLTGTAGSTPVIRDIWIDRERGTARFADSLTNLTDQPATLMLTYSYEFDQPVPAIHRANGDPIPGNSADARDGTLAFLQNQPEGMASAVVVAGDPKGKLQPRWRLAVNSESQSLEWKLDLPAQTTATVATWVIQRPVLVPADVASIVEGVFRNGRMIRPRLDQPAIDTMVNFPARGLSANDEGAGSDDPAATLAAVTRFADRLGIDRGETDVYYMNAKSLLEGETTGGPLVVESRFGALTVPLDQVAAVQGGGGRGRWPRVFFRDGHVLSGALTLPDWKISGAKGWAITLHADTLEAVVMRATTDHEALVDPATSFAQLTSGDILPLRLPPETPLPFITPWGPLEAAATDITGLWRVRQPSPAARLTLRNGTRLTVMPAPREITAASPRLGTVTLQATDLAALWPATAAPPDPDATEDEITSLEDLEISPAARALLRGSSVLAATLADSSLTLLSGGTETELSTDDILTLTRAETSTDAAPVFAVALASGATFEGSLSTGRLALKTSEGSIWTVPLSQFLGWKQGTAAEPSSP